MYINCSNLQRVLWIADYIPVVSTVTNLVEACLRCFGGESPRRGEPVASCKKHYYTHLKTKHVGRTVFLIGLPLVGSILLLFYDFVLRPPCRLSTASKAERADPQFVMRCLQRLHKEWRLWEENRTVPERTLGKLWEVAEGGVEGEAWQSLTEEQRSAWQLSEVDVIGAAHWCTVVNKEWSYLEEALKQDAATMTHLVKHFYGHYGYARHTRLLISSILKSCQELQSNPNFVSACFERCAACERNELLAYAFSPSHPRLCQLSESARVLACADPVLMANGEFMRPLVRKALAALPYASDELQNDMTFIISLLPERKTTPLDEVMGNMSSSVYVDSLLKVVPPSVKADGEFIRNVVRFETYFIREASESLKKDREWVCNLAVEQPNILMLLSDYLINDEFLLSVIGEQNRRGYPISFGDWFHSSFFSGERKIDFLGKVVVRFPQFLSSVYGYDISTLLNNRNVILSAVRQDWRVLERLHGWRGDLEVVRAAMEQDPLAVQYVHPSLQRYIRCWRPEWMVDSETIATIPDDSQAVRGALTLAGALLYSHVALFGQYGGMDFENEFISYMAEPP